ncbi:prepilin-type N-terminal cleavage/methylation domain-containing protein [Desulfosarcina ovata]|nr:prepilin-type N-terminal cleavage/methylation domain-containing protein [Desulfosarcina ovata]
MSLKNNNGFTLIELMVALVISSIVMAGIFSTYQTQLRSHLTQQSVVDMHQNARAAMYVMKAEIQMAGYDPTSRADSTVLVATDTSFQFEIDANGNGDCNDGNEVIRYALNGSDLGRATGTAGTLQPMAENIDAVDFVYFDSDMNRVDPAAGTLTEKDLASIRLVQVSIVARADDPVMAYKKTDTTTYKNSLGDTILSAQNDTARRTLLSTSVWCRNMGM